MVLPGLKGKGLFVFSDPGGAKPLLAFIESITGRLTAVKIISDRVYPFYHDFASPVEKPFATPEKDILNFSPDFVFTGTSYTSKIELDYLKAAHKHHIPTYSFVDHWTNISKRFVDVDGSMILPGKVLVIDERAKQIAIQEGIDKSQVTAIGNPYHEWLRNWKPVGSKNDYLQQIGLPGERSKILLFAPDPLSNVNGCEVYGFDELTATTTLVKLFDNNTGAFKNWKVLIKAHPNQERNKLNNVIGGREVFYMLPENADTNTSIYYADVVMGFFSAFLLESAVMNKPVIRFLPKELKKDPIAELNIGLIADESSLVSIVSKM